MGVTFNPYGGPVTGMGVMFNPYGGPVTGRHRRPDAALSVLRQDVIDGDIDRAHDLEALQVALGRGYRIFREPFAKRIDTHVDDLDERVAAIVRTWLEAMAAPPAT